MVCKCRQAHTLTCEQDVLEYVPWCVPIIKQHRGLARCVYLFDHD